MAITAGPDTPSALQATIFGALGGVLVVFSITTLDKMKIDDPVGAISVHGVVGLLGLLLVPVTNDGASFSGQIIGALTIFGWVFVTSAIAFFAIKMVLGLRVTEEEEYEGSDLSECGMEAIQSLPQPSNYPVLSWQFGPLGAFGPIMDPWQGLDDCRAMALGLALPRACLSQRLRT